ncbi:MAG: acyl-CoA dehydrogenase family protein [Alphaproteobacteria bacterium]|nr:acyl-CoA dehydrogenase family protein [Alphaproteobacteria bacterium]
MDFNDTQEEAAFRAETRAFLSANAEPKDRSRPTTSRGHNIGAEEVKRAKAWQAKKADAGFAGITWPKRFGGRELSPMMQVIYQQEESNYVVPSGVFEIGLGMCIPTLMAYAKPEQLERHVRPALRGEDIWCQLFSEPAGGSDLAALRTRAVKDGDDWVINGQKIWTSGAHLSDWGILVTRTDPNVPKHAGLTFFFLNMKSPGIEIRPIHQISGASHFNEVFLNDVFVPDDFTRTPNPRTSVSHMNTSRSGSRSRASTILFVNFGIIKLLQTSPSFSFDRPLGRRRATSTKSASPRRCSMTGEAGGKQQNGNPRRFQRMNAESSVNVSY